MTAETARPLAGRTIALAGLDREHLPAVSAAIEHAGGNWQVSGRVDAAKLRAFELVVSASAPEVRHRALFALSYVSECGGKAAAFKGRLCRRTPKRGRARRRAHVGKPR